MSSRSLALPGISLDISLWLRYTLSRQLCIIETFKLCFNADNFILKDVQVSAAAKSN